jgi:hypothetical protein
MYGMPLVHETPPVTAGIITFSLQPAHLSLEDGRMNPGGCSERFGLDTSHDWKGSAWDVGELMAAHVGSDRRRRWQCGVRLSVRWRRRNPKWPDRSDAAEMLPKVPTPTPSTYTAVPICMHP